VSTSSNTPTPTPNPNPNGNQDNHNSGGNGSGGGNQNQVNIVTPDENSGFVYTDNDGTQISIEPDGQYGVLYGVLNQLDDFLNDDIEIVQLNGQISGLILKTTGHIINATALSGGYPLELILGDDVSIDFIPLVINPSSPNQGDISRLVVVGSNNNRANVEHGSGDAAVALGGSIKLTTPAIFSSGPIHLYLNDGTDLTVESLAFDLITLNSLGGTSRVNIFAANVAIIIENGVQYSIGLTLFSPGLSGFSFTVGNGSALFFEQQTLGDAIEIHFGENFIQIMNTNSVFLMGAWPPGVTSNMD
jgi:hypothetical protein